MGVGRPHILVGTLAVLALFTVGLVVIAHDAWSKAFTGLEDYAERWRDAAPLTLALATSLMIATWIVFLLPSTPVELLAAYVFGFGRAFIIVYTGKVLGSLASFFIGQRCGRQTCSRRLTNMKLLKAMERAVSRDPIRLCFLVRASYIPIVLKNYGFGLLGVRWPAFIAALFVVEVYTTLEFVTLGTAARGIGDDGISDASFWHTISLTLAAIMLILLGVYGGIVTRRELRHIEAEAMMEEARGSGPQRECMSGTPGRRSVLPLLDSAQIEVEA